jgi:hypothetical protein
MSEPDIRAVEMVRTIREAGDRLVFVGHRPDVACLWPRIAGHRQGWPRIGRLRQILGWGWPVVSQDWRMAG